MSIHHGSCHCGAVRFDAELDLTQLSTCNCSICGRTGAIMAFVPAEKLTNVVGEASMTDYQFGRRNIHHLFCTTCGVRPFGRGTGRDGQPMAMVNVRCLEDVDVHTLEVARRFDGRSM